VKCNLQEIPYRIFGYRGKQVRDNIHSYDLVNAFWHFSQNPKSGSVYNMGGSRHSNCSVLEAIHSLQEMTGKEMKYEVLDQARSGDHIWWISDVRRFQKDFPHWAFRYDLKSILSEIIEASSTRLKSAA
jgi:CDP-paratose 2-epimerase